MNNTSLSANASVPLSVYACAFTVIVNFSRVQEIFPFLQGLKLGLLSLVLALASTIYYGRMSIEDFWSSRESKLMTMMFIFGMFSIPFSVWPGDAFETWKVTFLCNLIVFICIISNTKNEKEFKILHWSIVLSAMILVYGFLSKGSTEARSSITSSYDANDLAMIMVSCMPLVMVFFFKAKWLSKTILGVFILLMILTILKSGSRGALISFSVVGLVYFIRSYQMGAFKKVIIIVSLAAFVVAFIPDEFVGRFKELWSGADYNLQTNTEGPPGRLEIWKRCLTIIQENPTLGVGVGQSPTAMGLSTEKYYLTAHNSFLQVAVEMGLIGFVVYLAILKRIWSNNRDVKNYLKPRSTKDYLFLTSDAMILSLAGYIICSMFLSLAYMVFVPVLLALSSSLMNFSGVGSDPAENSI